LVAATYHFNTILATRNEDVCASLMIFLFFSSVSPLPFSPSHLHFSLMRYLPHTDATRTAMRQAIGVSTAEALFSDVPPGVSQTPAFSLPTAQGDQAVERHLGRLARQNLSASQAAFFVGGGVYYHHLPASVDALIQRGEFLTSYTPYQPEIAQGTLQYLFEFQTMVAELTGMDVANASLYDGSNAAVEAVQMACRLTGRKKARLSGGLHPHYRQTIETYARWTGFAIDAMPPLPEGGEDLTQALSDDLACVVVQYPDFFGHLGTFAKLAEACHANGILLVAVVTEILSLGALEPPGAWGADIVAAEGQSLGIPMSFGGPHVGLFACRQEYLRQMPGRLCGQTVDSNGERGFVLTLSTREQHIRREKATSNICTNAGLCALAFTIHLSLLGQRGLQELAALNHAGASALAQQLSALPGVRVLNKTFFNEFTVELPVPAAPLVERCTQDNVLAGIPLSRFYPSADRLLLIACTEMSGAEEQKRLIEALRISF
jgi:glycine dehydrogenase subunit 1